MAHVYLLHFSKPLAHARHYCGYTPNGVQERLDKHRNGTGARLTQVACDSGIELILARTWEFDHEHDARVKERRMKNTHNLEHYCPICRAERRCKHEMS